MTSQLTRRWALGVALALLILIPTVRAEPLAPHPAATGAGVRS